MGVLHRPRGAPDAARVGAARPLVLHAPAGSRLCRVSDTKSADARACCARVNRVLLQREGTDLGPCQHAKKFSGERRELNFRPN